VVLPASDSLEFHEEWFMHVWEMLNILGHDFADDLVAF